MTYQRGDTPEPLACMLQPPRAFEAWADSSDAIEFELVPLPIPGIEVTEREMMPFEVAHLRSLAEGSDV